MAVTNETIYIKGDKNVEVTKPDVTLGDIISMECSNTAVIPKLKAQRLLKFPENGQRRCVVSALKIVECIHKVCPGIDVQNLGEMDVIITYEGQQTPGKAMHVIKVVLVLFITFIGAAFTIMAFNNDVNTSKLFEQIYQMVTGKATDGFTIMELTYCIGLIIGILVFFNHFGGKKFSVDPTPMEVEMRLYENDIQTTLVENYSRKGQEIDVGQTNPTGNHRS